MSAPTSDSFLMALLEKPKTSVEKIDLAGPSVKDPVDEAAMDQLLKEFKDAETPEIAKSSFLALLKIAKKMGS